MNSSSLKRSVKYLTRTKQRIFSALYYRCPPRNTSEPNYDYNQHIRLKSYLSSSTESSSNRHGSVSSEEVSKFSSLSSTWWNASQNPLLSMNPIRVKRILQVIRSRSNDYDPSEHKQPPNPLSELKALDVGCGGGVLSESLARLGASVTAIDPSKEIVNVAKQRLVRDKSLVGNIDYQGGVSVEDLANDPSNHGMYNIICILEVIEHASNPQSLIQAAAQLLKRPTYSNDTNKVIESGGILFVSTLNRTAKSYLCGIVGAEHLMRLLPVGTHNWHQFKTPEEVKILVEGVKLMPIPTKMSDHIPKLTEIDVCGMTFEPDIFARSFKWSLKKHDLDMNWIGAYGFK